LEPYIDARSFPVIWFVQNVGQAIAVEISNPRFVEVNARRKDRFAKISVAIAK